MPPRLPLACRLLDESRVGGGCEQRRHALFVEARLPSPPDPPLERRLERRVLGRHRRRQRPRDERPLAPPRLDEAFTIELPIRLQHRVRVDRQRADHVLDGRQLIARLEQTQPERLLHLLNQLKVGGHAGVRIKAELDHDGLFI